jgi:cell division protease FtsH
MRKVPLAPNVDPRVIARGTPGFSGADLANLVNEAALLAARRNKRVVTMAEFEDAKDKVLMGTERRSMVMTDDEKKLTAYHEGGHALVNMFVPGNDPLHKITIIPRGRALGLTYFLPERDRYGFKKSELLARLATAYGGRIAEEIIFGPEHITTGAGGDIQQATAMARRMVTEWGMSEKLGAIRYNDNQDEVFLGHSVARTQNISSATAKIIDEEVRRICDESEALARKVLTEHLDDLHVLAKALLEYETLSGDEAQALLRGETIRREDDTGGAGPVRKPRASVPTTDGKGKPGGRTRPGGLEPEPQPGG